jgi:hypothetical protein
MQSTTSTTTENEPARTRTADLQGEPVETPDPSLFERREPDWQKLGVLIALVVAGVGALWHYADVSLTVKSLVREMSLTKDRSDKFVRDLSDLGMRVWAIERSNDRTQSSPLPPRATAGTSGSAAPASSPEPPR